MAVAPLRLSLAATILLLYLVVAPARAAAPAPAADLDFNATSAPKEIIGGAPTKTGEYDAVVSIIVGSDLCTGTVVAPRLVLTAAHCFTGQRKGTALSVYFGPTVDVQRSVAGVEYGTHPQFCPTCKVDIYDYAYVTLAQDFRAAGGYPAVITDQDEWDEAIVPGHQVILVGYGEDPSAGTVDRGIGTKRATTTQLDKQTPEGLEFYAGGEDQDSCAGDSGGPAFIRLGDGTLRLAGITSRGSNPCGSGGYYGVPYPALTWVREQTGVDLLGSQCPAGDCLDMAPLSDGKGCTLGGVREELHWWLLGLVVPLARRRRRYSPSAARNMA